MNVEDIFFVAERLIICLWMKCNGSLHKGVRSLSISARLILILKYQRIASFISISYS